MFRSVLVSLAVLFPCAAPALAQAFVPLAWKDLVNRPDRWPSATTVVRTMQFQSGTKLEQGTALRLLAVGPGEVDVVMPNGSVAGLGPDDCDLVAAANAYLGALTPAQRELTLTAVAADPSLIPTQVTVFADLNLQGGGRVAAGTELELYGIQGAEVIVMTDKRNRTLLDAPYTDVLFRARELLAKPESERPDRVGFWLAGITIDPAGKPVQVASADYYVLLRCSSACSRCTMYSPQFLDRYKKSYARRNDVSVVTLSNEARDGSLQNAKDKGFPWPIVPLEDVRMIFNEYGVELMPGVIAVDKFGRIIASNRGAAPAVDSGHQVLDALDAELKRKGAPPPPEPPLGSADNPVLCDMPAGELAYLSRLRCPDGSPPSFERTGGLRQGPNGSSLDAFTLTCGATATVIYMDMFAPGHVENAPVPGFTIVPK